MTHAALRCEHDDDEAGSLEICPVTGSYCTGEFCDDYGCAKKNGIWDDDPLEATAP